MIEVSADFDSVFSRLIMMEHNSDIESFLKETISILKSESKKFEIAQSKPDGTPLKPNKKNTKILGRLWEETQLNDNYKIEGDTLSYHASFLSKPKNGKDPALIGPTHHFGKSVNIFGRGVLYTFPDRPYVGLSPEGISKVQQLAVKMVLKK